MPAVKTIKTSLKKINSNLSWLAPCPAQVPFSHLQQLLPGAPSCSGRVNTWRTNCLGTSTLAGPTSRTPVAPPVKVPGRHRAFCNPPGLSLSIRLGSISADHLYLLGHLTTIALYASQISTANTVRNGDARLLPSMTSIAQEQFGPLPVDGFGTKSLPYSNPRPAGHRYSTSSSHLITSKSRKSLAALARDKVATLANTGTNSTPLLRSTTSLGNITKPLPLEAPVKPDLPRSATYSSELPSTLSSNSGSISPTEVKMAIPERNANKMHQTSSKILRMTDDERPFTRDFKDLFSTLITSLPLTAHRVRFTKIEETFLSEEAITNLGSLKFSQSNRIPDPSNPSRWVVTTTTTTFSMAKEMARQVCQRFVDARFIESADGKTYPLFPLKGAIWQLTPKGIQILKRFCDRNGIEARHIEPLIRRAQMQIVVLERESENDKMIQDKTTVEVVFRRLCGVDGPNLKSSTLQSDSDSLSEYATGLIGVKMARDRRIHDKYVPYTFTGKAASDWLLDCCTVVDRRETFELCELFVKHQLMTAMVEDRNFIRINPLASHFQPTKYAIYAVTEKGQRICGWLARPPSMSSEESSEVAKERKKMPKDTNMNRFNTIMSDPAMRMLFREHLRLSLCEENLNFWLDVQDFLAQYKHQHETGRLSRPEAVKESLATAYGLYNSFLAAGAPSELNIDHSLRNKLDGRMTQTETGDDSMRLGLEKVVELIELASISVAKLMDSVPKFLRDPRYQSIIREHQIDVNLAQRAMSPIPSPKLPPSEKPPSRSGTTKAPPEA